jgi:hypothetical protein
MNFEAAGIYIMLCAGTMLVAMVIVALFAPQPF